MKTHDQRAYEDAFEQRQRDYYIEQALKDCSEAVNHAAKEMIATILADVGNLALLIEKTGDIDDKIAFVKYICSVMDKLISKYAEVQANLDYERRERER